MSKIYIVIGLIVSVFIGTICLISSYISSLKEELNVSQINNKAYQAELVAVQGESNMYKLSIEQLNYFNDSITNLLKETQKDLRIKDKNLKQLQYISSVVSKTDTIIVTDTIFKTPNFKLDTITGDQWYKLDLNLQYPNLIRIKPTFTNKSIIIVSAKKETVNPPKKWWWQRLFQKKHTVIKVNIVEQNPYSEIKEQRFIEILK